MLKTEIKTASDLRDFHEEYNPDSHFFTRETMKFFGDTMKNYGVCQTRMLDKEGNQIFVWELYRRRPVKYNNQRSNYFDMDNFKIVAAFH